MLETHLPREHAEFVLLVTKHERVRIMLMSRKGNAPAILAFALSTMASKVRSQNLSLVRYNGDFAARELHRVHSVSKDDVYHSTVFALVDHAYHGDDVAILGFIVCESEAEAEKFAADWKRSGGTDEILKS